MTKIPASQFGDQEFAELNHEWFDDYIKYRLHGYHSHVAFRRTFGEEHMRENHHIKIEECEHNPYVRNKLERLLKEIRPSQLWDEKKAVHELLSLARNVFEKGNVRLGAIKELNVLLGITVQDERGNSRKGMSLDEFYKHHGHGAATPGSVEEGPKGDPNEGTNTNEGF